MRGGRGHIVMVLPILVHIFSSNSSAKLKDVLLFYFLTFPWLEVMLLTHPASGRVVLVCWRWGSALEHCHLVAVPWKGRARVGVELAFPSQSLNFFTQSAAWLRRGPSGTSAGVRSPRDRGIWVHAEMGVLRERWVILLAVRVCNIKTFKINTLINAQSTKCLKSKIITKTTDLNDK